MGGYEEIWDLGRGEWMRKELGAGKRRRNLHDFLLALKLQISFSASQECKPVISFLAAAATGPVFRTVDSRYYWSTV